MRPSSHRPAHAPPPRPTIAAAAPAVALALPAAAPAAQVVEARPPSDPVAVDGGRVAGTLLPSGVRAYLGIPYAAPPVRELRWRAPQAPASWRGVRNADRLPPDCPQPLRAHDTNHYGGAQTTSEDCLYLNVWAPTTVAAGEPVPVVVWVHGGGGAIGSSAMPLYDGEPLARKGVVYVSFNYRLGALGGLAHPELTAESAHGASGNYADLDMIAALRWVQRNAGRFGGDPANVTVMGQSFGSMAVGRLQASPLARGLLHKVVGMSGGPFERRTATSAPATLADAERSGVEFQAALGAGTLAALRAVPADRIVAAARQPRRPYVDGHVLPQAPEAIFARGEQSDVPLLVGHTRDEVLGGPLGCVRGVADFRRVAVGLYGDAGGAALLRLYPARTDDEARRQALRAGADAGFGLMTRDWMRAQLERGRAPVYSYLFAREHPYAPGVAFADFDPATAGAYHASELPYFLGTFAAYDRVRTTRAWTDDDRRLGDELMDALVAFARTGRPTLRGVAWPSYDRAAERRVEIGDGVRVGTFDARRMELHATAAQPAGPAPACAPPRG